MTDLSQMSLTLKEFSSPSFDEEAYRDRLETLSGKVFRENLSVAVVIDHYGKLMYSTK